jgi:hypothetical protein
MVEEGIFSNVSFPSRVAGSGVAPLVTLEICRLFHHQGIQKVWSNPGPLSHFLLVVSYAMLVSLGILKPIQNDPSLVD